MQCLHRVCQQNQRQEEFPDSVRISNVRDYARNDQHAQAMSLLKKQRSQSAGLGPSSYAPNAQAFNKLSDVEREQLRVKFDIAYFVAIENLPYKSTPRFVTWKCGMVFALVSRTSIKMLERSSYTTLRSQKDRS